MNSDNVEIVEMLLDKGANIDGSFFSGMNALMWASFANKIGVTSSLVRRGANVHMANDRGNTALSIASESEHTSEIKRFLENEITKQNTLMEAVAGGNWEQVEELTQEEPYLLKIKNSSGNETISYIETRDQIKSDDNNKDNNFKVSKDCLLKAHNSKNYDMLEFAILEQIRSNKVENLDLRKFNITDNTVKKLAEACKENTSLKSIALSKNYLPTNKRSGYFIEALQTNTTITSINLGSNILPSRLRNELSSLLSKNQHGVEGSLEEKETPPSSVMLRGNLCQRMSRRFLGKGKVGIDNPQREEGASLLNNDEESYSR
jgi:hypothetical protein